MIAVVAGILIGLFYKRRKALSNYEYVGSMVVIGYVILLFYVGIDLGIDGGVVANFKKVGWRIAVFPFATIMGTMVGVKLASLFLPITTRESMAIGAGFGWYTLAPVILSKYSAEISAISFIHNIYGK